MLDTAAIIISQGKKIAYAYAEGVNDNMIQSHFHDFFELYYLLDGERLHMIEGETYHFTANDFVLFPPHIMHYSYGEKDMPFKRIVLYFTSDLITDEDVRQKLLEKVTIFTTQSLKASSILPLLQDLTRELDSPGKYHDAFISNQLNRLLLSILRLEFKAAKSIPKTRSAQAVDYIHIHYMDDISVNQLAEMLYISPYHLCHEFKNATGKTIIQYLNTTRILHAQRLMLETDYNITRISREVGFSNLTHFNRIFKKVTGVNPSEKKKQYKTNKW